MNESNATGYKFYFEIDERYVSLFEGTAFVWEALTRLPAFLQEAGVDGSNSQHSVVHPTAFVHSTAILKGSYIGPHAKIYEGAVVRDSIVGDNSVIGHASEIARSIVLDKVSIPRFDYIGASIVGTGVRLGGMIACASRRFDSEDITIRIKGKLHRTSIKKLGSIIGDNSMIGFGVHCNPGTLIGPNTLIMPQVETQGFIPPNSLVVVNQKMKILRRQSLSGLIASHDDGDE